MLTFISRTIGFVVVCGCALVGAVTIVDKIAEWKNAADRSRV